MNMEVMLGSNASENYELVKIFTVRQYFAHWMIVFVGYIGYILKKTLNLLKPVKCIGVGSMHPKKFKKSSPVYKFIVQKNFE